MTAEMFGVAAALALLGAAAAWARRRPAGPRGLEVLETAPLGAGRTLAVVRAGRRRLLLGVTGQSIATLAELEPDEGDQEQR